MKKPFNIGLIGVGDMGMGHLRALKHFPHVKIAAVCDTDEKRLHAAGGEAGSGAKMFRDAEDLLALKEIEAVFVSVPDHLHAKIGLRVLKAGKHLFLEKPLAHSVADGQKILNAWKKMDLVFFCGHIYRFSPFYQEMFRWIAAGAVGRPVLLWCHEFREPFPQRDWFYDRKKTGGTFVEKNCHHFDLFNWMTGDAPKKVAAFGGQKVLKPGAKIACSYCPDPPKKIRLNNIIDHGWAMVEYQKGAKASLGLCMFLEPPDRIWRGLELGIIGENGKMLIGNVDFNQLTLYGGIEKEKTRTIKNPFQGVWHSGMMEEHEAFLEAIRKGARRHPSVAWGLEALKIGAGAERSVRENKIIEL